MSYSLTASAIAHAVRTYGVQVETHSESVLVLGKGTSRVAVLLPGDDELNLTQSLLSDIRVWALAGAGSDLRVGISACPLLKGKLRRVRCGVLVGRLLGLLKETETETDYRPATSCDIDCVFEKQFADALRSLYHDLDKFVLYHSLGKKMLYGTPTLTDALFVQSFLAGRLRQLGRVEVECAFLDSRDHLFSSSIKLVRHLANTEWSESTVDDCQTSFVQLHRTLKDWTHVDS